MFLIFNFGSSDNDIYLVCNDTFQSTSCLILKFNACVKLIWDLILFRVIVGVIQKFEKLSEFQ